MGIASERPVADAAPISAREELTAAE
jgi:hypothetical protein